MRVPELIHRLAWSLASIAVVAPAAAGPPQGGGEPGAGSEGVVLRQASLQVTVESPLAARIDAEFEIVGDGDLELLLARLPGQTLSELRAEFNGQALDTPARGTGDAGMRRLRLPLDGGTASLRIGYFVRQAAGSPFRYPLVVPAAVPLEDSRSVRLVVTLPAGAVWAGDSFPRFDRVETDADGTSLEARLIGVPALAYVAFDSPGAPLRLDLTLEIAALALVGTALALWTWRWRRRSGGADGDDPSRRQRSGEVDGDGPGTIDG